MKKRLISAVLSAAVVFGLFLIKPTDALAQSDIFATVSAGHDYTFVIKSDGSLWAWGYNNFGHFGIGDLPNSYTPVKITDDVAYVSSCNFVTMILKTDGSLWASGLNEWGFLGDGTRTDRHTSFKLMDGVASVSVGKTHCAAIKKDGSLWVWGFVALDDGTAKDRLTPVKVMDDAAYVSAGNSLTMVIKTDGSLWTWGTNYNGMVGDGTTTENNPDVFRYTPTRVMENVATVFAGDTFAMAIKTDGSLWTWGSNNWGQLGDGTNIDRSSPVRIMDNVASVSAGGHKIGGVFAMAIRTDGTLWAWGSRESGRIGDGTSDPGTYLSPVKVMDAAAFVSAGSAHTMAVKTDGSLWAWGSNEWGAFGNAVAAVGYYDKYQPSPVKIMDGIMLPKVATPKPLPPQTSAGVAAKPTASTVLVNNKSVAFDAYNIKDNNYFKLRDLAYVLSGTGKQFDVGWDGVNNAISLTSGKAYTIVGGEMTPRGSSVNTAVPTSSEISIDGKTIMLAAYNIGGNNYFKLRDIGQAFDFSVTWDGTKNTIVIDTDKGYTSEEAAPPVVNSLPVSASLKKGMTDAEFEQAYAAASEIAMRYAGKSIEDQLQGLYKDIRYISETEITYSDTAKHYNDVYGFFVLKVASCAGETRAIGLCLTILGIPYEHVNENKWSHQWCRVEVNGTYWICDAYGLYVGPEPAPYKHPWFE